MLCQSGCPRAKGLDGAALLQLRWKDNFSRVMWVPVVRLCRPWSKAKRLKFCMTVGAMSFRPVF